MVTVGGEKYPQWGIVGIPHYAPFSQKLVSILAKGKNHGHISFTQWSVL
jgi:hypothetical protein